MIQILSKHDYWTDYYVLKRNIETHGREPGDIQRLEQLMKLAKVEADIVTSNSAALGIRNR